MSLACNNFKALLSLVHDQPEVALRHLAAANVTLVKTGRVSVLANVITSAAQLRLASSDVADMATVRSALHSAHEPANAVWEDYIQRQTRQWNDVFHHMVCRPCECLHQVD